MLGIVDNEKPSAAHGGKGRKPVLKAEMLTADSYKI
jgi:hypothetical protein